MSTNLNTLHWCEGQERPVVCTCLSPLNQIDDLKLNESSEINDKTCVSFKWCVELSKYTTGHFER